MMNKRSLFCVVTLNTVLVLFVFQPLLENYLGPFKFWDEFFGMLLIPAFLYDLLGNGAVLQIRKSTLWMVILLTLFSVAGIYCTMRYHYQPTSVAIRDCYLHLKFFLAIGTAYYLFHGADRKVLYRWVWPLVRLLVLTITGFVLADLVLHIFPAATRFGLRSEAIFYGVPSNLAAIGILFTALLFRLYEEVGLRVLPYLGMSWLIILTTLRTKAVGGMFFAIFVFLIIILQKRNFGFVTWTCIGLGMLALSAQQFSYYYSARSTREVRRILTTIGFRIMHDYFPFGSGFATFGSAYSGDPYSRVYYLYHINRVWGLTPERPSFVSDTFWPMIMGQTGVVGLVLYVLVLVVLAGRIYACRKVSRCSYACALLILAYMMISSTSESSFVNPMTVALGMVLGLMFMERC